MADPLIAVIDLGTTGNRAVIISLIGQEVAKAYREYAIVSDEPGQSEQDAKDWWRTTQETLQEVLHHPDVQQAEISAVSVCTHRATMVPLDKEMQPLARAITWMDSRLSPSAEQHQQHVKQRPGLRRALFFKDNQPKLFDKIYKFAEPDAYLYYHLCDVLGSDLSHHIYGILDRSTLKLSDELGNEVGVPVALWSDIITPSTVIGEVTSKAAKATGLAAGTPVIVGGGDQQCSLLGLGVLKQGVAKNTTGTGTFLATPVEKETRDPMGTLFCNPHVLPDQWVLEGVLPGTGMILRWFRDEFGHVERAVAERLGCDPYDFIVEEAAQAPPGCDGLVLFPLFTFSLGILQGLGFQHRRTHIARAILESAAYATRFYVDTMSSAGVTISELRLDGGGARSRLWRQIQCDINRKPAIYTGIDEGTALGAAILAAKGSTHYSSVEKAVEAMVHIQERHTPSPELEEVYNRRYSQYQQILMNNLQEIMKHV